MMASNEAFKKAEDEFFRLKGQLAAGRITNAQFNPALNNLVIEHEGRWWIIGANSSKWYVHAASTIGVLPKSRSFFATPVVMKIILTAAIVTSDERSRIRTSHLPRTGLAPSHAVRIKLRMSE
jgi:hypothetical protein